jgi:hypothetical protein
MNTPIDPLFSSKRHGENSTKRDPPKTRRRGLSKLAGHMLGASRPGLTTGEVGEKRKPETEIVDQREEIVQVSNSSVPYLTSEPIPNGKRLKKVVITVVSKDQGWSGYQDDHGTYRNSHTWFELSVGQPSDKGFVERWRGKVVKNLHAHDEFKQHVIEISDRELYEKAKSGDVLTVWAHARFQGWRNTVKKATIRYVIH